jgi:hypothetical protein
MAMVMVTIRSPHRPALDELRSRFGLDEDEVDRRFGVIEVDDGLFTVRVDEDVAERLTGDAVSGPHADVRIEPFGPPRGGEGSPRGGD